MQLLPRLSADRGVWRLPLAEDVAARLSAALLCDDSPERRQRWTDVLSDDPALTLWAVCRAERWMNSPPRNVAEITGWLAESALAVLQWSDAQLSEHPVASQPVLARWSQLRQDGLKAARAAAQLAGDASEADQAYLWGLLHGAIEWLGSSGPAVTLSACEAGAACLPRWLTAGLRELNESNAPSVPLSLVREALKFAVDSTAADSDNARADIAGCHLPLLVRKLTRLKQLEMEFAETLEREKLDAMKELAYGASHEVNNPLANISTRAQALLRDEKDPERRRKLATINSQAFRAHEMISNMMLFARPPAIHPEPVEIASLIDEAISELENEAAQQGTELCRTVSDDSLIISADGGQLVVALKAMITNSLEALGSGGSVEVAARLSSCHDVNGHDANGHDGRWAEITVRDTGPGIPPEVRRHLFDPFYSGREAGRGLGFGLSKCWRIVTLHGGQIVVASSIQGAEFTIRLPAVSELCVTNDV
jgi:signal transduction histidine kinase